MTVSAALAGFDKMLMVTIDFDGGVYDSVLAWKRRS